MRSRIIVRSFCVSFAIILVLCLMAPGESYVAWGRGEKFPSKPIEYVVQSSPGGGSDTFVRVLADMLVKEKIITVPIVVVNKPGGGGAVSYKYTASKAGNPYFLQNIPSTFVTTPLVSKDCPNYKEFTPIGLLAYEPIALGVKASSPYKTVKDLIDGSKTKAGGFTWAHTSVGNFDHLTAMLFAKNTGANIVGLPMTADNDVLAAVMGGHTEIGSMTARGALGQIKAGEIRFLAISAPERLKGMEDVPTLKELGVDVMMATPRGVIAPKNLPDDARNYLIAAFKKLTATPRYKKFLEDEWMVPANLFGDDFGNWLITQTERLEPILKEVGLIK